MTEELPDYLRKAHEAYAKRYGDERTFAEVAEQARLGPDGADGGASAPPGENDTEGGVGGNGEATAAVGPEQLELEDHQTDLPDCTTCDNQRTVVNPDGSIRACPSCTPQIPAQTPASTRTRRDDPDTSLMAAARVDMRAKYVEILTSLEGQQKPVTYHVLIDAANYGRITELDRAGLIESPGSVREGRLWEITDAGRQALRNQ